MEIQRYICEKCGDSHPTETHDNLVMMKLTNPDYLPSRQEVLDVVKPDLHDDADSRRERFFKHDEMKEMGYELLNQEFIEAFANYLVSRIEQYQKDDKPVTILEVGAGTGRLARFINEKLRSKAPSKFEFFATNLKDGKYDKTPAFPVEEIGYKEALKKYNPTIVISSWMPYEDDWTADFRANSSVQEYILIGERASTGQGWLTWGDPFEGAHSIEEREELEKQEPPHELDGFDMNCLEDVSDQQIKSPVYGSQTEPVTYSFRRISK